MLYASHTLLTIILRRSATGPTVSQMTPTFRKAEPATALRAYLAFAVI